MRGGDAGTAPGMVNLVRNKRVNTAFIDEELISQELLKANQNSRERLFRETTVNPAGFSEIYLRTVLANRILDNHLVDQPAKVRFSLLQSAKPILVLLAALSSVVVGLVISR